ncbi:hypothetical protein LJC42_05230 [Eubacteriales bacterium OttesenSCG-928-K08]|nr:hypothetical protein [Eubacteriales bacterium OttesenSCG-928-K08]
MENDKRTKKRAKGIMGAISSRLKANPKLEYAVYAVIVLLIVLLYVTSLFPSKKQQPQAANTAQADAAQTVVHDVEQRLEQVLSSIRGAGKVEVMITYETGPELVTAMNTDTNTNVSESVADDKQSTTKQETQSQKPATISDSGGTAPIILTEKQPTVRGVIVIADGAGDLNVRLNLQLAVQTVLDVPVNSIEVFERAVD